MSSFMNTSIARAQSDMPRVQNTPRRTTGLRDSDLDEAVQLFDRAVIDLMHERQCKAEDVASEIGCSYQHLSNYRNGSRTLAFHRVLTLAHASKVAALVFARIFAALAGCQLVPLRKATKSQIRAQLALNVECNPAVLKLLLPDAASRLGIDPSEAAEILDEPSVDLTIEELRARGGR